MVSLDAASDNWQKVVNFGDVLQSSSVFFLSED